LFSLLVATLAAYLASRSPWPPWKKYAPWLSWFVVAAGAGAGSFIAVIPLARGAGSITGVMKPPSTLNDALLYANQHGAQMDVPRPLFRSGADLLCCEHRRQLLLVEPDMGALMVISVTPWAFFLAASMRGCFAISAVVVVASA
jgi:hypothetical protein